MCFSRSIFRLTECNRWIFPASGRDVPHQADFPRVDFQPLHSQTRDCATVNHMATAKDAFKRVTPQELPAHLCITHLWHRRRVVHPQRGINPRQLFSAHPVGQKTKIAHHPEEMLWDVLLQPRHNFRLCRVNGGETKKPGMSIFGTVANSPLGSTLP